MSRLQTLANNRMRSDCCMQELTRAVRPSAKKEAKIDGCCERAHAYNAVLLRAQAKKEICQHSARAHTPPHTVAKVTRAEVGVEACQFGKRSCPKGTRALRSADCTRVKRGYQLSRVFAITDVHNGISALSMSKAIKVFHCKEKALPNSQSSRDWNNWALSDDAHICPHHASFSIIVDNRTTFLLKPQVPRRISQGNSVV
ncbi:hypothetical protein Aperf_G00000099711 [Anoplocephala perfoliata]